MVVTPPTGHQLSEVLHTLGAGRRPLPGRPVAVGTAAGLGAVQRVVEQFGANRPVQADPTSCGSAALVVLAAAGDPTLARWLATGTVRGETPRERFEALQHVVTEASLRRGLGLLPWPGALGTPPWGAARVARFGDLRYTHRLVVDTRADQCGPLLDHAVAVVRAGVPVLLYTGGDSRAGLGAAVPRHVVVLASPDGRALEIYEPGSGRMLPVTREELAHGGTPRAAYGGWSHVTWVVLPRGGGAGAQG